MHFRTPLAISLLALALPGVPTRADPIGEQAAPYRWVESLVPERAAEPEYRAYYGAVDRARAQAHAGQYRRALVTLRRAGDEGPKAGEAKVDEAVVEHAIVKARALAALGRGEEAVTALSGKAVEADARAAAARGDVLVDLGRFEEAIALLESTVARLPNALSARRALGRAREAAGDVPGATQAYAWFVEPPQDYLSRWRGGSDPAFEGAEAVTTVAGAIDRWASLTGAYRDNPGLHNAIYDMFVKAYDTIDRTYAPAKLAAAEYAMSHDQDADAEELLRDVLADNPNDPAALVLMGRLVLEAYNFDAADAMAARLRGLDDASPAADLLEARALLVLDQPADAATRLDRVLAARPRHAEALGLLAASHHLRNDARAAADAFARADAFDPDDAVARAEAADVLRAKHRHADADAAYRAAIGRAPNWTRPRNGLGLLLAQGGDTDAARAALEAARALDPFNHRTTNYLRVLDDMANFGEAVTEHFVFRYDKADALLVDYVAPYMEGIYDEVTTDLRHEPPVKTYVEIFPTADAFSVRTAGQMGIESFGVSMGQVVTTVAPRGGQTLGQFNWARVLRHEFTHTVNLSQTDFRCPRWLTEGLAVWQERVDFRFSNVPRDMHQAATNGKLLPVKRLGSYFLRPDRRINGEVAYMQGMWIVLYLREAHGPESVITLLNAYSDGQSDEGAFTAATGAGLKAFEPKFFEWAKRRVSKWGYDDATVERVKALSDVADGQSKAGEDDAAIATWEQVLALQPVDPLPRRRLAGLHLRKKDLDAAIPHLVALLPLELKDNRYAKRVARIHRDAGRLAEATSFALQSIQVNPYDADAHTLMLELAEKTNDAPAIAREKRALADLAKLAAEKDKVDAAE